MQGQAGTGAPRGQAAGGEQLAAWLRADEIDRAIDAGLMEFSGDPALDPASLQLIEATRRRLHDAWQARERYRARQARLERRRAEREARRPAPAAATGLPPAAAAALARAKARVSPK